MGLSTFFNDNLVDYAIKYGYDESSILILEDDADTLSRNHLQVYTNLLDSLFHIELSGANRNRMILENQKTSTSSDYIIASNEGLRTKLELVNDYTGFWARNHSLHLRDNKYLQLQRNHCLLLAIALTPYTKKFSLLDFGNEIVADYIPQHRSYGYKPAYELQIPATMMHDFSIESIRQNILQTLS